MVPGQWVWEAGLVGVEVDSSHARFVPTAGRPRGDDGVSEAAICQPASIALVQATAPGSVELASGGQGGILGFTEGPRFLEGELLEACGEEHFPWGQRQWQCDGSYASSEESCSHCPGTELLAPLPCSPGLITHLCGTYSYRPQPHSGTPPRPHPLGFLGSWAIETRGSTLC